MQGSFEKKSRDLLEKFKPFSLEKKFEHLIEMGRKLPSFPEAKKREEYLVKGCQSLLYLYTSLEDGKCFFQVGSDALISKGLAALLISVYGGESPETILKHPPLYIQELKITAGLSPNRSNGLAQIYLKMQQDALRLYRS